MRAMYNCKVWLRPFICLHLRHPGLAFLRTRFPSFRPVLGFDPTVALILLAVVYTLPVAALAKIYESAQTVVQSKIVHNDTSPSCFECRLGLEQHIVHPNQGSFWGVDAVLLHFCW